MSPAELALVRRRLVAFAAEVFEPLARADQRRWDWRTVRQRLATQMTAAVDPDAGSSMTPASPSTPPPRSGSPASTRGTLGKVANCWVGVSIHAATDQASCPIDWRLFPPKSWDQDQARRHAAHLPERVRHRPKWQLALDMVDELGGWGLVPPVVIADAGYGESGELRLG